MHVIITKYSRMIVYYDCIVYTLGLNKLCWHNFENNG